MEVCVCVVGELDSPNQGARNLPRRVIRSVSKSNVSLGTQVERGIEIFLPPLPMQRTDTLTQAHTYNVEYVWSTLCQCENSNLKINVENKYSV